MLKSRTSPASYGVLCKEPYDAEKHLSMQLERDEFDGKLYAIDIIHWFIKKVRYSLALLPPRSMRDVGRKLVATDGGPG